MSRIDERVKDESPECCSTLNHTVHLCTCTATQPHLHLMICGKRPGMRIRIRSDPVIFAPPDPDQVIFAPPDPDPVHFSTDPDPTCNNGFIKKFYLEQNINQNQQIQA